MMVFKAPAVTVLQRVLGVRGMVQERLVGVDVVRIGGPVMLPPVAHYSHHGAVSGTPVRAAVVYSTLFLLKSLGQTGIPSFGRCVSLFLLLLKLLLLLSLELLLLLQLHLLL